MKNDDIIKQDDKALTLAQAGDEIVRLIKAGDADKQASLDHQPVPAESALNVVDFPDVKEGRAPLSVRRL